MDYNITFPPLYGKISRGNNGRGYYITVPVRTDSRTGTGYRIGTEYSAYAMTKWGAHHQLRKLNKRAEEKQKGKDIIYDNPMPEPKF